jgi:hypothetical protein
MVKSSEYVEVSSIPVNLLVHLAIPSVPHKLFQSMVYSVREAHSTLCYGFQMSVKPHTFHSRSHGLQANAQV